jgi:TolB-like protein/tetratricopeptide (TPR) repeat protein
MLFHFDGYVLDPDRRELHRGVEAVALEPQVFDLLLHLLRNRDHVISKDELIETVWGRRIVSDATIDSRIKAARQAVGDSGAAQRLIRTMPRKGVRFVAEVREESPTTREPVPNVIGTSPVPPRLSVPDKPSIAVLAFANMSSDHEQEFFSDGITEDITMLLSKSPALFVIARNSSFTFKGRAVDVKTIGQTLGVRYLLEGSVRKVGNRIRVVAQLIDATTAEHVWAEQFDRDLTDIFAVQDEITALVSTAILPAMQHSERERLIRQPPNNLDAWECYHRGMWHFSKTEVSENITARELFQRAIALDPRFSAAHAGLALTFVIDGINFRDMGRRDETTPHAIEHARQSIELNPMDELGHVALASALQMSGRLREAMIEAEFAVSLNQNSALAYGALGYALAFGGRPREAIGLLKTAMRLSPFDPQTSRWLSHCARAYYLAGDYEAAIATAQQLCRSFPKVRAGYRTLIAAFGQTAQAEVAQSLMKEAEARFGSAFLTPMIAQPPELSMQGYDHMIDGYRKAGVIT